MDWCIEPYEKANHPPTAVIDGDASEKIRHLEVAAGDTIHFDASQSADPDGDELLFNWWVYREVGTYPEAIRIARPNSARPSLRIRADAPGTTIHLMLEVRDRNEIASLSDYRRIILNVR